jgi:STE24 endopeptidase
MGRKSTPPTLLRMPSFTLTLIFAAVLVAAVLTKFWLINRQIRHVAQNRPHVPDAFATRIGLEAHQKAADYTVAKSRFGLLDLTLGTAVLIAWTLLGGLNALNHVLHSLIAPTWGHMAYQLALICVFTLIGSLLDLPMDLWRVFRIEQRFGFNRMSLKLYLADLLKSTLIGALIGLPVAALLLWLMSATGSLWWLWAWGAQVGLSLLLLFIYPTWIAPLFNKFEPLSDESLKTRVQSLMARCGFTAKGFFVMDGSKRSAHANAYFTGLGAAKRVVFFDTLLSKLNTGEVEAVLAHELGHFKHRHVLKGMVLSFALSAVGFALLGYLSAQSWFYEGLGVQPLLGAPNSAVALLLFLMVVPVFTYFVSPLSARLSRKHEFQADAYACQQADGADLGSALLKLHEDNATTLTPDPVYAGFYYSHPPALQRLAALTHRSQIA